MLFRSVLFYFVFWVGIAHSGTLISAVLYLFRARFRMSIYRIAEAMTVFAVFTAGLFPIIHLGRLNGIKHNNIIIDPGIGFGKNLKHNLRIMSKISIYHSLGYPIMIGTSRKRFIEHIVTKFDTPDRTGGTLGSVLYGLLQGVQLFRVHNVKEINQGILVFNKILNTN